MCRKLDVKTNLYQSKYFTYYAYLKTPDIKSEYALEIFLSTVMPHKLKKLFLDNKIKSVLNS